MNNKGNQENKLDRDYRVEMVGNKAVYESDYPDEGQFDAQVARLKAVHRGSVSGESGKLFVGTDVIAESPEEVKGTEDPKPESPVELVEVLVNGEPQPEFKFRQKVRVTSGFYAGIEGTVRERYCSPGNGIVQYLVREEQKASMGLGLPPNEEFWVLATELEER